MSNTSSEPITDSSNDKTENLKKLLSEAAILVAPTTETTNTQESSIEHQLAQRLKRLQLARGSNINEEESVDNSRSVFVDQCLALLLDIEDALLSAIETEKKESERDYLGVRDLRVVHTLLQVVISWGLYPCFLPGVGVPLSKRVKSAYANHELLSQCESLQQCTQQGSSDRRLLHISTQLVDMTVRTRRIPASNNYTTVSSILLSRYLPDLFAALLQLAYRPVSSSAKPQNRAAILATDPSKIGIASSVEPEQNGELLPKERDKCARMFAWLFERSDVYCCMESLMLLLGTSPLHPVPLWLRNICGRYLSRILLRPNGIRTVMEYMLSDVEQVQLDQLERISKLILSVPQQMPSVESYYAVIAPQLLALLRDSVKNAEKSASKGQATTFIIGKMTTQHTELAKTLIVQKIVGKFLESWNEAGVKEATNSDTELLDPVAVSENEMSDMLELLHRVMVGGEPSPVLIQTFLGDSISALYYLYDFVTKSKSSLKNLVLDILTTYFRIMTTKDAIHEIKRILFNKDDVSGMRVAYFAPGATGGAEMRFKSQVRPLPGNQLPLDPKSFVEFIQHINSSELPGDLFVFLLNEYSSLQTLAKDTDPKLMLLMLNLIMGMQDSLGHEILSRPEQILAFASNVITDHVERIEKSKSRQQQKASTRTSSVPDIANIISHEEKEEEIGDISPEDEWESLVMAIGLLRAVMHENEDLSIQAVHILESVLVPLRRLESYRIEPLQEPLQEVMLAISSFLSARQLSGTSERKHHDRLQKSKDRYQEAMKALQDDLLPVRAHGISILRDMVLAKDPLVSSGEGLDSVLDIFVRLVQDEDSFIYLNSIKGLSALTDVHGNEIIKKLGAIYSDENQTLDNRLRVGEALLQTIQRAGSALGRYVNTLLEPLGTVLGRPEVDARLRTSSLSILSVACQSCPVALTAYLSRLVDWVLNILVIEKKSPEVRRAATVVILSLFRGLGPEEALYGFPSEYLKRTYRTLRYIEDTDPDELTRHQARTALSDLDVIVRRQIFRQ